MKVLITGASGLLGRATVRNFKAAGHAGTRGDFVSLPGLTLWYISSGGYGLQPSHWRPCPGKSCSNVDELLPPTYPLSCCILGHRSSIFSIVRKSTLYWTKWILKVWIMMAGYRTILTHLIFVVIVHCAAERRPDVAEKDHEGTLKVSREVTKKQGAKY